MKEGRKGMKEGRNKEMNEERKEESNLYYFYLII